MEEEYFVQVNEATDVRRNILHTSKQLIALLKRFEKLKRIRIQKIEQITKLRLLNKELKLLTTKLKKEFPEAKVRIHLGKEKKVKVQKQYRPVDDEGKDELMHLETQLQEIEAKISRLG